MKRIGMVFAFLAGLFMIGCGERSPLPPSQAEQILKGEHLLRKMTERTDISSRISASFFLFVGDLSGTTKTTVSVKFAWEMNDGIYALSSLPFEKIRVKLDEKTTTPTIKFRWRRYRMNNTAQLQNLMDEYVSYAIITVRESNWPIKVDLPLNSR